ncbi:MAG: N-acetylmuramoyl-L-alanine amidase [Bacilli bacterium]|nr:N-acetylmuramoyl-L-alanine amidase [Bacilli bacterium]
MYKFKISIFVLLVICLSSFYLVEGKESTLPLLGKIIYVDPGHGGADPGALYKKIKEKDINLEISQKLEKKLTTLGATVYMTRYGDYDLSVKNTNSRKRSDLSRRVSIINRSKCDIYLSIHLNADRSQTWQGIQVFYDDVNAENKKIAETMESVFKKKLNAKREYKELTNIYLHRKVERPGILIEVGFLSNPNDRYLLRQSTYQQKVVGVIAEGLMQYWHI